MRCIARVSWPLRAGTLLALPPRGRFRCRHARGELRAVARAERGPGREGWCGGLVDGTYKGDRTILRSDNGADIVIVVRDDHFNWIDNSVFVSTTILDVAITAGGSFSKWGSVFGLDGTIISPVKIEGRITGNKFEADIDGGFSCVSHLSLTKSYGPYRLRFHTAILCYPFRPGPAPTISPPC